MTLWLASASSLPHSLVEASPATLIEPLIASCITVYQQRCNISNLILLLFSLDFIFTVDDAFKMASDFRVNISAIHHFISTLNDYIDATCSYADWYFAYFRRCSRLSIFVWFHESVRADAYLRLRLLHFITLYWHYYFKYALRLILLFHNDLPSLYFLGLLPKEGTFLRISDWLSLRQEYYVSISRFSILPLFRFLFGYGRFLQNASWLFYFGHDVSYIARRIW